MLTRNKALVGLALVTALAGLRIASERFWPEGDRSRTAVVTTVRKERGDAPSRADPAGIKPPTAIVDTKPPTAVVETKPNTPALAAVAATQPSSGSDTALKVAPPIQLQVRVPSDVQVGDVFEAQVHIHANAGVRQLMFAVAFDKSRLELVASSAGAFAQQGGGQAEFGAEEPSDGNIQVNLDVRNGSPITGAGALAIFKLRALKRGTSPIVLQNLNTFDATGVAVANASVLHEGRVIIH
jgi:hypothetical protein